MATKGCKFAHSTVPCKGVLVTVEVSSMYREHVATRNICLSSYVYSKGSSRGVGRVKIVSGLSNGA